MDGRSGLLAFAVGEFVRELVAQQERCEPRFTLTPSLPDKPMLRTAMATAGGFCRSVWRKELVLDVIENGGPEIIQKRRTFYLDICLAPKGSHRCFDWSYGLLDKFWLFDAPNGHSYAPRIWWRFLALILVNDYFR